MKSVGMAEKRKEWSSMAADLLRRWPSKMAPVRRPSSVAQDYEFAPGFIEQHLWWLKIPIFEWQSLSNLSHLKIVFGSATVPMAFWYFSSTCRMFRVFPACLIPSFTRCRHVERYLTISSQLSMSDGCRLHIPLANIFEAKEWATSFTCTSVKLAVEEVLWNHSFSHPVYVSQPSKVSLAE